MEAIVTADSYDDRSDPGEGRLPLDELTRRQGVRPITSVDELVR